MLLVGIGDNKPVLLKSIIQQQRMPVGDVPRVKGENLLTGQILLQLIVISIVVQVLGYLSRRIGHHPVITCNAAQRSMNCAANFRLRQRCNGEGFLIKLVKII